MSEKVIGVMIYFEPDSKYTVYGILKCQTKTKHVFKSFGSFEMYEILIGNTIVDPLDIPRFLH
jgi:hypothetical protein